MPAILSGSALAVAGLFFSQALAAVGLAVACFGFGWELCGSAARGKGR